MHTGFAVFAAKNANITGERVAPVAATNVRLVMRVESLKTTRTFLVSRGLILEPTRVHSEEKFEIFGFQDPFGHNWRLWAPLSG